MYGAHQQNLLQGFLRSVTKRRGWSRLRGCTGSLSCRRPTAPRLLGRFGGMATTHCIISRHGCALCFGTATVDRKQ
jgi:hypothetical protein